MIIISMGIAHTRGTRIWAGNLRLGRKGHIEFVFDAIPGHLGVLGWINWEVR